MLMRQSGEWSEVVGPPPRSNQSLTMGNMKIHCLEAGEIIVRIGLNVECAAQFICWGNFVDARGLIKQGLFMFWASPTWRAVMDISQISILTWTILTLIALAILVRYQGVKFLLDLALAGLIIVLIWSYWHHNRPNNHNNGNGPANLLEASHVWK